MKLIYNWAKSVYTHRYHILGIYSKLECSVYTFNKPTSPGVGLIMYKNHRRGWKHPAFTD